MADDLIIICPTAGRRDLLERTLDSLSRCRQPSIYRETIVVENGPRSAGAEVTAKFQKLLSARYLHVERANKSNALNEALCGIDDRALIYFIDDDIRLANETLECYAAAAQDCGGGVFFGGPFGVDYDVPPPEWLRKYLPKSACGWNPEPGDLDPHAELYLGFNWAAFAGDIRRTGMFDPEFGPGGSSGSTGQETNMQQRMYQQGIPSQYVSRAMVWHYVPKSRCSEAWAVGRRYRTGVYDGRKMPVESVPKLFGVPRQKYRKLLRYWWRYIKSRFSRNDEKRFQYRYDLARFSGLVSGIRQSHQLKKAEREQANQPALRQEIARRF